MRVSDKNNTGGIGDALGFEHYRDEIRRKAFNLEGELQRKVIRERVLLTNVCHIGSVEGADVKQE